MKESRCEDIVPSSIPKAAWSCNSWRVLRVGEGGQEQGADADHGKVGEPLGSAGLWETWKSPEGELLPPSDTDYTKFKGGS